MNPNRNDNKIGNLGLRGNKFKTVTIETWIKEGATNKV